MRPLLRRFPAVPVLAVLIAVTFTTASSVAVVRAGAGAQPVPAAGAVELAAAPPTTSTTLPLSPPPAAPAAEVAPAPPPGAHTPLVRLGEIRIPKIGLVHPIYEGVTLDVVDRGPGHWPGSAMPGQLGNAVFAGHRVTHSRPFRNIDQLAPGDEIIFRTDAGEFTYRVTGQQIVWPKDTWIVNPTPDATVTIFACHPPGSARQRIVVRGVYAGSSSRVT